MQRLLQSFRHHRLLRPLTRSPPVADMSGNIQNIPLSVLLSWPQPNYDNPERRSWMPVYAGILQAASTLTVITRLWLRAKGQAGPLGLDDVRTPKPRAHVPPVLTSSQALLFLHGWDQSPSLPSPSSAPRGMAMERTPGTFRSSLTQNCPCVLGPHR